LFDQHAGLRETSMADVAAVGLAVAAADWLFPVEFTLRWVYEEMADLLPLELDFEHVRLYIKREREIYLYIYIYIYTYRYI